MKWRLSFNVCQNLIQWKVSPWHRNVSTFEEREISHQAININWVQCAVRGLVLNYPVEGSRTTLVERWELIGLLRKSNCVTGRICRMSVIRYVLCVWSAVIPSRATCPLGKLRSRSPMQVSNSCVTCATRLAILRGPAPIGANVFSVGSRVTSREIAPKKMIIGTVILSWMYQAPPLLKPLAVPLLSLLLCFICVWFKWCSTPCWCWLLRRGVLSFCHRCVCHWSCLGYPTGCRSRLCDVWFWPYPPLCLLLCHWIAASISLMLVRQPPSFLAFPVWRGRRLSAGGCSYSS